MDEKRLSESQIRLIQTLADRHGFSIPFDVVHDYSFGKKFLDLFAFDPDKGETTGFRRITIIESYLYYDKEQAHLQFKLELDQEDVAFMIKVLAEYKYGGALPREDEKLLERDPEDVYYEKMEAATLY